MKKILTVIAALSVIAVVAAVPAAAQGRMGAGGPGWLSRVTPQTDAEKKYVAEVQKLHEQIRQTRWEQFNLQNSGADDKQIAAKQKELNALREKLHKVNDKNRELHWKMMDRACEQRGQEPGWRWWRGRGPGQSQQGWGGRGRGGQRGRGAGRGYRGHYPWAR